MTAPVVLFDEVIHTDYGQFDLIWADDGGFDGNWDRFFAGQVNGLVGAADPSGVYLNLARRSGGSPVRALLHSSAPALEASHQDVVEVSITIPLGRTPQWVSWAGETAGEMLGLVPGCHRLRVSARDRDAGRDGEFADGPVDAYLLDLWPAPWQEDTIVLVGSDDARYWHTEIGSRRAP